MDMSNLFNMQGMMFLLMAAGVILKKRNIITNSGKQCLTDLVIDFILPCNIIASFFIEFNKNILLQAAQILIIAILIQIGSLILSRILYCRQCDARRKVLQYGTVCSNAGFLGNPITEGIYGADGLLYASVYLIPQRIVMWSAGISYFTESPNRKTVIKKVITHPCIVAVIIGFFIMVFQVSLPSILSIGIKTAGSCTTALSMLVIGSILADVDMKTMVSKTTIYYVFIRLFVIPLLVFTGCRFFQINSLITGVSVILAGMPAGSTTAILAAKYDGDADFATKCVVFSTILSLISIPAWCMVL